MTLEAMSWWQRQRVPLIALGAAIVAAVGVHVWLDVLPTFDPDEITTVQPGQSVEVAGQTLSLTSTRWDEFPAPESMHTLSILLKASGGADASLCSATSLTDPATGRVWVDGRSLLDERPEIGESTCTEESGSYDVLAVFVVPDDTTGPFEFDVPGGDVTARFLIDER